MLEAEQGWLLAEHRMRTQMDALASDCARLRGECLSMQAEAEQLRSSQVAPPSGPGQTGAGAAAADDSTQAATASAWPLNDSPEGSRSYFHMVRSASGAEDIDLHAMDMEAELSELESGAASPAVPRRTGSSQMLDAAADLALGLAPEEALAEGAVAAPSGSGADRRHQSRFARGGSGLHERVRRHTSASGDVLDEAAGMDSDSDDPSLPLPHGDSRSAGGEVAEPAAGEGLEPATSSAQHRRQPADGDGDGDAGAANTSAAHAAAARAGGARAAGQGAVAEPEVLEIEIDLTGPLLPLPRAPGMRLDQVVGMVEGERCVGCGREHAGCMLASCYAHLKARPAHWRPLCGWWHVTTWQAI